MKNKTKGREKKKKQKKRETEKRKEKRKKEKKERGEEKEKKTVKYFPVFHCQSHRSWSTVGKAWRTVLSRVP